MLQGPGATKVGYSARDPASQAYPIPAGRPVLAAKTSSTARLGRETRSSDTHPKNTSRRRPPDRDGVPLSVFRWRPWDRSGKPAVRDFQQANIANRQQQRSSRTRWLVGWRPNATEPARRATPMPPAPRDRAIRRLQPCAHTRRPGGGSARAMPRRSHGSATHEARERPSPSEASKRQLRRSRDRQAKTGSCRALLEGERRWQCA